MSRHRRPAEPDLREERHAPPTPAQAEPLPRRGLPRRWQRALVAMAVFNVVAVAILAGGLIYYAAQLPAQLDTLRAYNPSLLSEVYSADGEKIGEFYLQRRIPLYELEATPPHVRLAFLAAEDGSFYDHPGLDPLGIARAFVANLLAGRVVQGGSTITQQVVKNLLLTPERTLERKVKEAILSVRVESAFSKDEILAIYLDLIYLGHGAYGVQAAAQGYFGKDAKGLSIAEAALLAGLVKAPTANSPFRHFDRARRRQLYVLAQMEARGMITAEEANAARDEPLAFMAAPSLNVTAAPEYVEQVRRIIVERYGGDQLYRGGLRITAAVSMGLQRRARLAVQEGVDALEARRGFQGPDRVLSRSRWDAFRAATWRDVQALRVMAGDQKSLGQPPGAGLVYESLVIAHGTQGVLVAVGPHEAVLEPADLARPVYTLDEGERWERSTVGARLSPGAVVKVRWQGPGPDGRHRATINQVASGQGALMAMEPHTGKVRAMVGAYDPRLSRFNRATQSRRQPGSTFKPFIYAAAVAAGHSQMEIRRDAPRTFRVAGGRWWSPGNYGGRYYGEITLRTALAKSLNSVAISLMDEVGVEAVLGTARRLGITSPMVSNLTSGLGTSELSLAEITTAYTSLASAGREIEPVFIERIETTDGEVLFSSPHTDRSFPPATLDGSAPKGFALDPAVAFVVTDMLTDVVENGTARRARGLGRPTAGKTGTTNDYRDAWFVGFTPELVAGVWVGNDGNHPMGPKETGGGTAAPIWHTFMSHAVASLPPSTFALPPGVIYLQADPRSGAMNPGGKKGKWLPFRLRDVDPALIPTDAGLARQ